MSSRKFRVNILAASSTFLCAIAIGWMAVRMSPSIHQEHSSTTSVLPETLRVALINAPYTCYEYRDTTVGYDYELIHVLADSLKRPVKVIMASNISEVLDKVSHGEVDIAAAPIADTQPTRSLFTLCGPERISYQVLVQRKSDKIVEDPSSLSGHTLTIEANSRYEQRIKNLNSEIGGDINIVTLNRDTISDIDLIRMVVKKEIEMTVVDSDLAEYSALKYPELDFSVPLSLEQRLRWAVNPKNKILADYVGRWTKNDSVLIEKTYNRYYKEARETGLTLNLSGSIDKDLEGIDKESDQKVEVSTTAGITSVPYIRHFKTVAARHNFDWRLVAAVAFVESRYTPDIVSWAGARGIMQVMPGTARAMGINPSSLTDPATCIEAGVRLLVNLDKAFSKHIPDPSRRRDFVLASYNAGMGHILDAIALAEKYGLDASHWEGGVSKAALMKSKPKYYHDPVVKNGYFHAHETVDFVRSVNAAYREISKLN